LKSFGTAYPFAEEGPLPAQLNPHGDPQARRPGTRRFITARDDEILPWDFGPKSALGFPVRTVSETFALGGRPPGELEPLDIGCAVGLDPRFELSRHCAEVIGIDYSEAFVDAAETMADRCRKVELPSFARRAVSSQHSPHSGLQGVHPDPIRFARGDAMDLGVDLGSFDVVHAANRACRLSDPARSRPGLPDLVSPGGQLVLDDPLHLVGVYAAERWPVGSTLDLLQNHLEASLCVAPNLGNPLPHPGAPPQVPVDRGPASLWERLAKPAAPETVRRTLDERLPSEGLFSGKTWRSGPAAIRADLGAGRGDSPDRCGVGAFPRSGQSILL